MAVTMAEISKLRNMTGAGMMDCKKALIEANNDMEKAIEIIRKRGQAIAAKRSDRDAAQGCVLAKAEGDFAAIVALKCETDFVAKNADFVALTKQILDEAIKNRPASIDELKNLMVDGRSIADLITDRSGEKKKKMELGYYETVSGKSTVAYVHPGNMLATVASFAEENADMKVMKGIAMQVAAMTPVALDRNSVDQKVIDTEMQVAIDKTKAEQVQKAVEAALKKAGFNLYIAESEEHLNEGIMKGMITEAQAQEIRDIKEKVAAEKAANLPEQMVQNIAKGRLNKFFQESTLVEQQFVGGETEQKMDVQTYLKNNNTTVTGFRRVTLNQE